MQKKIIVKDNKLLKLFLDIENNTIKNIQITGDFFAYPEEAIQLLEKQLQNHPLEKAQLEQSIAQFITTNNLQLFGISQETLVNAIMQGVQ